MRLSEPERAAIQAAVRAHDDEAKVYLFGSRADDRLRGGDIDLLVISERLALRDKLDILSQIKDALGEQKIDLLIKSAKEAVTDSFVAEILKTALPI